MSKGPGGRPSKYKNHESLKIARQYIQECANNGLLVKKEIGKGADGSPIIVPEVKIPCIEGLARRLRVSRDTINSWANRESSFYKKEFSDIVEDLNCLRAEMLQNGALSGLYASSTSNMLLSKLGYKEEKVQETNVNFTIKGVYDKARARLLESRERNVLSATVVETIPASQQADTPPTNSPIKSIADIERSVERELEIKKSHGTAQPITTTPLPA